jgi:IS30 family transposase
VGTLVERTTRFVLFLHLPGDHPADAVDAARRATDIPIYFCGPPAPWQCGSNEDTDGLLRQYLPKGIDLSQVSATELRQIQRSLNGRPRKISVYMTPSEKFTEVVASTICACRSSEVVHLGSALCETARGGF